MSSVPFFTSAAIFWSMKSSRPRSIFVKMRTVAVAESMVEGMRSVVWTSVS